MKNSDNLDAKQLIEVPLNVSIKEIVLKTLCLFVKILQETLRYNSSNNVNHKVSLSMLKVAQRRIMLYFYIFTIQESGSQPSFPSASLISVQVFKLSVISIFKPS